MRISDWSSDVCSSDLLLAPQPRDGAHWAFPPLDPAADATQHRVARVMAVDIVDRLEPVDIDEQQRRWQIIGACAVEERRHAVDEIGRAACRERVCQYV